MPDSRGGSSLLVVLIFGLLLLMMTGLCSLLGDPPREHETPQVTKDVEPPSKAEATDEERGVANQTAPINPQVRLDAEWPAYGARDQKAARAVTKAILEYMPRAGMSDQEKGRRSRKLRSALKTLRAVGIPYNTPAEILEETSDLFKVRVAVDGSELVELWTSRRTIEGYTPTTVEGELVDIAVQIAPMKPDGRSWDVRDGAPDIAVCTVLSDGQHCFPGDFPPSRMRAKQCQDSYSCVVADVRILQSPFEVFVVDVDLSEHDVASRGMCSRGKRCEFELAAISVSR